MAYDKTQLRLLVPRTNADGMNAWTLDSVDALSTIEASGYISNALKALATPGVGMIVGDKIIVRRWTDLTSKIAANLLSVTEHIVLAVVAAGATLSSAGGITAVGTAVAGAVTMNGALQGKVTTESLTTAAGAEYTLTITDNAIELGDIVLASVDKKSSTGTPGIGGASVTAGQVVITVTNLDAAAAFNNVIQVNFKVFKV